MNKIILPELGEGINDVEIRDILVKEGESIDKDQTILILETDKIDIKPSMIQPVKDIKSIGEFQVKISLHSEVDAEIKINVESADTIQ